jgi:uncharacterized protein (TIGR02145 family)
MRFIIWLLLISSCFFSVSGQNLRFPVNKKLVTDVKGNVMPIKLLITETGKIPSILFSEIHQPNPNSTENYYLVLGSGQEQTGNLPTSFTHPEKWEIRVEVKNASAKAFQSLHSIPLNLICGKCWFQTTSEKLDKLNYYISIYGDTLFFNDNNHFLLYSGLSSANYSTGGESMNSNHSCGLGEVHNPALTYGRMKDQDGNEYKTIQIGKQVWMAENLKVAHFQNGDKITQITEKKLWRKAESPAYSWFNNDSAFYECPYGRLYNAWVVNDSRKVCPAGWHVPDKSDWNYLVQITGGGREKTFYSLKTSGFQYWAANGFFSGANSSGFSALPGAARFKSGRFDDFGFKYGAGYYGLWWTSDRNADKQTSFGLMSEFNTENSMDEFFQEISPQCGLSIRCIRDENK